MCIHMHNGSEITRKNGNQIKLIETCVHDWCDSHSPHESLLSYTVFYPSSLSSLLAKNGVAMTKVPWIDLLRLYTLKANQHQHCLAISQIPTYALKAQFHRIVHIFSQWPCSTLRLEMIFDKKYASNKRNTLTKANVRIKLRNRTWYWSTVSFHKNDDYIYIDIP